MGTSIYSNLHYFTGRYINVSRCHAAVAASCYQDVLQLEGQQEERPGAEVCQAIQRLQHLDQTLQDFVDWCHTICDICGCFSVSAAVHHRAIRAKISSHFVEHAFTAGGMTHCIGRKKRIAQFQSESCWRVLKQDLELIE